MDDFPVSLCYCGKYERGIMPCAPDITWLCGLYRMEDELSHFVVLTRDPVGELAAIHDRMPLILPETCINDWINPDIDPKSLLSFALTHMAFEKSKSG